MAKHQDSESEVFHVVRSDSQDDLGVLGARLAHHVWISSWQGLRVRSEDMVYVGASLCSGDSYTLNSRVMNIHTHPISGLLCVCSPAAISQPSLQSKALTSALSLEKVKEQTSQRSWCSLPGAIVPPLSSETPACSFCWMHGMSLGSVKQGPSSWKCVHYIWDLRQFHLLFLGMIFLEIYKTYRMG